VTWAATVAPPPTKKTKKRKRLSAQLGPQIFFTGPSSTATRLLPPSIIVQSPAEAMPRPQLKSEGVDFIKSNLPKPAPYFAIAKQAQRNIRVRRHVPIPSPPLKASDAGQSSIEHLTGILSPAAPEKRNFASSNSTHLPTRNSASDQPPPEGLAASRPRHYSHEKAQQLYAKLLANHTGKFQRFPC